LESTKSPSAGDVLPPASPGRPRHLAHDRAQAGEQEAGNLAPLAHPCGTSGGDQLGGASRGTKGPWKTGEKTRTDGNEHQET